MHATFRLAARSIVLTGAVGAAIALGSTGVAQAATPEVFQLCSGGNFGSFAEFPERNGYSTFIVNPGECHSFNYGGNHPERVDIKTADSQYIGSLTYDGRNGVNVKTVNGPSFYIF
ncbi:hypothetical protein [Amycolatopsis jejuensis]|uniref:hypothetical protein n=1 Tax=Amycolatopsis jejuensis TaxID=330084 RepID=UPI000524531F|nr:hypothetical protein [Amycolatopsis jejuensis]